MSPSTHNCFVCGCPIAGDQPGTSSWMNEYRALVWEWNQPGEASLSGVGLHNNARNAAWSAPSDPEARWDDADYEPQIGDYFGLVSEGVRDGRQGFILHNVCYTLLARLDEQLPESRRQGEKLPERLRQILSSLPASYGHDTHWGHSYGGLISADHEKAYPWQKNHIYRHSPSPEDLPSSMKTTPYAKSLVARLNTANHQPPTDTTNFRPISAENDRFATLPPEICHEIVSLLPTRDALNARLASRAFTPLFHTGAFWASRFRGGRTSRSWVMEMMRGDEALSRAARDWRSLYRETNSRDWQNTSRVFSLAQQVSDLAALEWLEPESALLPSTLYGSGWHFSKVNGDYGMREPAHLTDSIAEPRGNPGTEKCANFDWRSFTVPEDLTRVSVSLAEIGDAEYITGLKMTSASGAENRMGWFGGEEHVANFTPGALLGFNVGVGSRGIQCLQAITKTEDSHNVTRWLGNSTEAPKTNRIAVMTPITALVGDFDGMKMVGLSLGHAEPSPRPTRSLRDKEMWYPSVPAADVELNERSYIGCPVPEREYRPLYHTSFGGPNGAYLKHLTKMRVTCGGMLHQMRFFYDKEDIPTECQTFGRGEMHDSVQDIDFEIDGPGGERISAVEVEWANASKPHKHDPTPTSLKVYTTFGRSAHFSRFLWNEDREKMFGTPIMTRLCVAEGTTITGFYGSSEYRGRLDTLGVLSTKVVPQPTAPTDEQLLRPAEHFSSDQKPQLTWRQTRDLLHPPRCSKSAEPLKGPGYMQAPGIGFMYQRLSPRSLRDTVFNLWLNALPRYFSGDDGFVVTGPASNEWGVDLHVRRAVARTAASADGTTERLMAGEDWKTVVLVQTECEAEARGEETWSRIEARLEDKARRVVEREGVTSSSVYAIASVGRYSRFYAMAAGDKLMRCPATEKRELEFRGDEETIDQVLCEWRQAC